MDRISGHKRPPPQSRKERIYPPPSQPLDQVFPFYTTLIEPARVREPGDPRFTLCQRIWERTRHDFPISERDAVSIMSICFVGQALVIFDYLRDEPRLKSASSDELWEHMKDKVFNMVHRLTLYERLDECCFRSDESVESYAKRLRTASLATPTPMPDQVLANKFIDRLPEHLTRDIPAIFDARDVDAVVDMINKHKRKVVEKPGPAQPKSVQRSGQYTPVGGEPRTAHNDRIKAQRAIPRDSREADYADKNHDPVYRRPIDGNYAQNSRVMEREDTHRSRVDDRSTHEGPSVEWHGDDGYRRENSRSEYQGGRPADMGRGELRGPRDHGGNQSPEPQPEDWAEVERRGFLSRRTEKGDFRGGGNPPRSRSPSHQSRSPPPYSNQRIAPRDSNLSGDPNGRKRRL
ncbi:hypothetical protein NDN08_004495 [Rhodosorus marinus]|uniref:Retrotransposon gag domain-containing protein n=1 Tax=Rhodosorus marinus TaxID=101924 RepID=A0AAV8UQF1_9RHOD|nr:hypothetical protein NDN08_004495 [Rhodosorus marinus]